MNVERVISIANVVNDDLSQIGLVQRLQELQNALANQINSPNEGNLQMVGQSRKEVMAALERSNFDYLPTTWRSSLEELGLTNRLGAGLASGLNDSFEASQSILTDVQSYVAVVQDDVSTIDEQLKAVASNLVAMGLKADHLEPGQAELSFLIPRDAIDNGLTKLAKEISFFDKAVRAFSEIEEGKPDAPELRQLSTTDPAIFALVGTGTVLAFLKIVKEIICVIEKSYKMREARASAIAAEMDTEIIEKMNAQIELAIEQGLENVTEMATRRLDSRVGRSKELKNAAKLYIGGLAARIDNGFQVDGSAVPSDEEKEEQMLDAEDERGHQITTSEEVNTISSEIRFAELPEESILRLAYDGEEEEGDQVGTEGA
ncbi:hypothetical protein RHODOSMS8_03771 [Rhodobiaceae bacterium]|nr:hypothetical protein RHODOSMS8_03771 [Rhodobiaceae bacterium]